MKPPVFSPHVVVAASLRRGVYRVPPSTATQRRGYSALLILLVLLASPVHAQVGNNNPSGASGIFNGEIADGVDPYTGNVRRSVTDIIVSGAVGEYPLALVRTYNSRSFASLFGTYPFGRGGWNHNYNWVLEDSPTSSTANFHPTRYTVDFPDGRSETFQAVTWDSCYRVRPGADTPVQSTSAGVRERFVPLDLDQMQAYLLLPDGGKVEFEAVQHSRQDWNGRIYYYYKYTPIGIVDPYGLVTTFTWENLTGWSRLTTVSEPAGRSLRFTYADQSGRISQVTEVIGGVSRRSVNYYYVDESYTDVPALYLYQVIYYNDPNLVAHYQWRYPNVQNAGSFLLLTADDPMYSGPMKRIAYVYATDHIAGPCTWAVYGQILSESYWDGGAAYWNGPIVSTLSVCTNGTLNGSNYRMETRGDGKTRGFTYSTDGYLQSCTDFMNHSASQGYDGYKYINSVTDRNGHTTNFTRNALTGAITQIQYPLTQSDTPGQTQRPTVNYTYGSSSCADANNRDANNPYYVCTAVDEGGHVTQFTRDTHKRVTRIDYPDGGYETFAYNSFGQVTSHRLTTGGTEAFAYDSRGLKQTYRNPSNASGNPTAQYQYDSLDRVSGVTDALGTSSGDPNHTTNYFYNNRGQVTTTTLPTDPVDGGRHTIVNTYNTNGDGTLVSVKDQLSHITSYTYDDYRRLRTATPPDRGDNTGLHTTSYYYDANGTTDDYTFTDSNATWVTLPSGKWTHTTYDDNRRKHSVTVGCSTTACSNSDAATTSYTPDNVGNLHVVTNPRNFNTTTFYDERNRPREIRDPWWQATTFTYDTAGRKKTITRQNGQVITNVNFDNMNRVTLRTVTQDPTGTAGMTYSYYPGSGLLQTFQDPRLYGTNDQYSYTYDSMGRKHIATYPAEPVTGAHRTEVFNYDAAGRLYQYTTRGSKTQTFYYDALNRMTSFTWSDGTSGVSFTYDAASRLTEIDNANAAISRGYWNDNSLRWETEDLTAIGGVARTVSYTYDADGNRASISIPGYSFTYDYTTRNQLKHINQNGTALATYTYDENGYTGDLTTLSLDNGTSTTYDQYGATDRVAWMSHHLNGTTRTFNYGYDLPSGNRTYARRLGSTLGDVGDAFSYDLADQAVAVQHNVATPQNLQQPLGQNIYYDSNGNRNWYAPPGINKHYDPDAQHPLSDLNQYTGVIINGSPVYNLTYRADANLATYNGWTYYYDAQNRLTQASKSPTNMYFAYDGLNRQVSRRTGSGTTYYCTWDGWDLVEDYHMSQSTAVPDATYLYGVTGLVKNLRSGNYSYQDGSGSTSHLADSNGNLLEWYRYDLQGTPIFYNFADTQQSASAYGVRHLFTGQQWYSELGLYDLRNRFYSPDIGRFLQPDPALFKGDPTNLYRYCRNNPPKWSDPTGEYVETTYLGGSIYKFAIPIEYIGATPAQMATWNAGSNLWTGAFGRYVAITSVVTPSPSSPTNYVFVSSNSVRDIVVDHQAGLFDANTTTYTAGHEFGHFMNLGDRYHDDVMTTYNGKQYTVAIPNDPLSSSSIMGTGALYGKPPTEDDIRNIIMASLPQTFPPIQGPGPLTLGLPTVGGGLPLGVGLQPWSSVFSSIPWNTSWSINGWGIQFYRVEVAGDPGPWGWDFVTPSFNLPNLKVLRQGL